MQVSIITPSFNSAEYLVKMLESVAMQKEIEFEHIIIDDCSTDSSREVLKHYEEILPNLRVIYLEENLGQSRARNVGLDAATGEYIAFLDSDDYYAMDNALAIWYAAAKLNDADIVRANYKRFIQGKGTSIDPTNCLADLNANDLNIDNTPQLVNNTSCWLMIYKTQFLRDNDIRFSPRLRQREDRPFFLLALLRAKTVNLIPDRLIVYRVRPGSTMTKVTWEQLDLFATHVEITSDYIKQHASGEQRLAFRRANLLYCVKAIIEYWGPLLAQDDAENRAEFRHFFAMTQSLDWDVETLYDDQVLDRVEPAKLAAYTYDFALLLLQRGLGVAFHHFVKHHTVLVGEAVALAISQAQDSEARKQHTAKIIYHYLRRHPPLASEKVKEQRAAASSLPTVILHAGTTKTGSSSLQTFFEENRFQLYSKYGVYYPFAGLERGVAEREHRTSGHAGLLGNVLNGESIALEKMAAEVAALPTKPKMVFISSENIVSERFWRNGDAPRLIAAGFKNVDLRVVVYVRRQEDWLESAYVESVTSPGLRYKGSPAEFADDQRRLGLLDFIAIDTAWRAYFKKKKLTYRSYESALATGDTIDDFLPLLGITDQAAGIPRPAGKTVNESTPKPAAYLIRQLNHIDLSREKVVELNAKITEATRTLVEDTPDVAFYSEQDRTTVASLYDLGNRAFYNEYVTTPPSFREKPDLKDMASGGTIPVTVLDDFFATFLTAVEQSTKQKLRTTTGTQPVGKAKGSNTGMGKTDKPVANKRAVVKNALPTAEQNKVLSAFAAKLTTQIKAKLNKKFRRTLKEALFIDESRCFNHQYYAKQDPTAVNYPGGAIMHYVELGAHKQLNPNVDFDTGIYLAYNADVAAADINPLFHYLKYGKAEGRTLK